MKIICKMQGGSHSYGLNTPSSDIDIRGVFLNDQVSQTVGLDRFEHLDNRANGDDVFYFELRHYLNLLHKGNTQALEMLFNHCWIEVDPLFEVVQRRRNSLIDPDKLFHSLRGYMQSERRLANGERTGVLGSKRKAQLDLYGFSPKNFVQLLRLAYCGATFFRTGEFPVNIVTYDQSFGCQLMDIKTQPQGYTKARLNEMVDELEATLVASYEVNKSTINEAYRFNSIIANELLLELYGPIIYDQYQALAEKRMQSLAPV
ncbi:MAG: hypothetical protein EBU46_00470 [Nitrosomonadaceae bacterium]|nr:hypothetical protein [Nitrosomonadaceae bacterium]